MSCAWWCISSRPSGTRRSRGSGSGMQAAPPPYSKERKSGPSSSQVARRRARGRRAAAGGKGRRQAGRAAAVLEGAEERTEQLPGGQAPGPGPAVVGGGEVGDEEGVGEPALGDRLRDHAPLGDEQLDLVGLGLLLLELHA